MKQYRIWLEDTVEPDGGFWWYCWMDVDGYLHDHHYPDEHADRLQDYLNWGYKVEEVI